MSSYITSLATANPKNVLSQEQVANFMIRTLRPDDRLSRKIRALYKATGIEKRHSVIPDYSKTSSSDNIYFPPNDQLEPFPAVAERMGWYKKFAPGLAAKAANKCLKEVDKKGITHLVTVSCTGMHAPGLDIELVQALGLSPNVHRTCINFMGCYAMMNAFKVADAFCRADSDAKVLVVSVELSSLHFQKSLEWDHLLSNALFSDGAGAVLVENEKPEKGGFAINDFFTSMNTDGIDEMGWSVGDTGFEMTLTGKVPEYLREGLASAVPDLEKSLGFEASAPDYYAIHPGGKKILAAVEAALGIGKEQNKYAYQVLRENGNMSSSTIIFVLKKILKEESKNGEVLMMAFGPGLTVEAGSVSLIKAEANLFEKTPDYASDELS